MVRRKAETFEPVTMGHIRGHGCRDLLVYCNSGRCHHSATMNADWLADETPVRSLCRRMVCTKCGMIGAGPHVNKRTKLAVNLLYLALNSDAPLQSRTDSEVISPTAMAGGNTGLVLCQVGGQ